MTKAIRGRVSLMAGMLMLTFALLSAGAARAEEPATPPTPVAEAQAPDMADTDNPYGLGSLWRQGDFVAKTTLSILAVMSFGSWYILATKLLEQRAFLGAARAARRDLAKAANLGAAAGALPKGPFRAAAEAALAAADQHAKGLRAEVTFVDWTGNALSRAVDDMQARLQGGLAFLATVGSTAPFVGLFGTVWGIYHALIAIGMAGQASIDKVAGPVGEALIMTAIGLAVAVPAVLGYNWLVRRNKAAVAEARRFAADVQTLLLTGR
jgi:biopolymer transport protein ExbB